MNIKDNALITEAVSLLEKVEGDEHEKQSIKDCIRQLNAIALSSILRQK